MTQKSFTTKKNICVQATQNYHNHFSENLKDAHEMKINSTTHSPWMAVLGKVLLFLTAFLLLLLSSQFSQAQIVESFADDDFTSNPTWTGDVGDWAVEANSTAGAGATGSKTLRLNVASGGGEAQLRTQVSSWGNTQEWGFFLGRRSQAYSTTNKVYIWLYANEADLESNTVDGYRIAIGDNSGDDDIVLESVTDGVGTPVITGSTPITNGLTDIGLLIRVTRSATGDWVLFTSTVPNSNGTGAIATNIPDAANTNVNQGSDNNTDHNIMANGYFGLVAVHTTSASARSAVELDQIYLDFSTTILNPTAFTANSANQSINLSWTDAPTSDEVLIVASTSAFTSTTPTGDGSSYNAVADFSGAGTAFDGGKVVYKGTGTSAMITGLINNQAYNFKIFNRIGTGWSSGAEVSGTPEAIFETFADDNFTADPTWTGDIGEWTVEANSNAGTGATGSKTLRINASNAGNTQLRTQIADWKEAQEWGFFLGRRSQAYTDGNKVYIWLYANEEDLESVTVDGYRIVIGDDTGDDEIILESVTDGVGTPVITGSSAIPNGLEDIGLLIRVTHNASGDWVLFTSTIPTSNGEGAIATDKPTVANTSVSQGSGNNTDHNIMTNGYFGLVAVHTGGADARSAVELDQVYLNLLESPKTTVFTPADETTGVDGTADLEITFDRNITKGTGDISIRKVIDGEEVQTVDVSTGAVTIVDNVVTINPSSDLAAGVEFYINIPNAAFQDAAAPFNNFVGISDKTTWNFTVDRATLVAWDFPDASADAEEDNAIAANNGKQLSTTGGVGALTFSVPGVTEKSAGADNWAGGANTKAWQIEFATTGYDEIKVSSKQRSASGAPTAFKLQYSLDGTDWLDVENSEVTVIDDWTTGVLSNVALPKEASHQSSVYVRWLMTSDAGVSPTGNSYIDDIAITGREDIINPVSTTFSPEDDAVNVPVNTNLEITFSEAVKKGTGNIVVKNASDDSNFETVAVTSNQVIIEDDKVIINLTNNLENDGSGYYVNIPATAFNDNGGQGFKGITNKTTWNFNSVDEVGPEVTNFNPNDNAEEVAVGSNLVVTFNENIKAASGNIEIRKSADDAVIETTDVTGGIITISGNQMTINPSADLDLDTQYYVLIANGAITDNSDNPYAGITNKNTWNFRTTDGNPPLVTQFRPADNTTDVDPARDFQIVFNEQVQKHTVGDIRLVDDTDGGGNQTLPITSSRVDLNWNRRMVTIDFASDLVKGHQYHIEIDAGALKDDQDNDYAGISDATTWNFVVANRPYAVTFTPADDELDVAIDANLVIEFDEDIAIGSGNIIIRDENNADVSIDITDNSQVTVSGTTVTIDPTSDLIANTNYHVRIPESAFQSVATGELYRGINNNNDWNFKTIDNVAPLLISFTPADGSTEVLIDSDLEIEFNERVRKGTGNITLVNEKDNSQNIVIDVTSNQVIMNNNDGDRTIIIRPTGGLDHSTTYHVLIAATAFKDISAAENTFAGISDDVTWNFETVDLTPPSVTAFVPADNFTNAEINTDLQIIFDENVQKGTGGNVTITDGITPVVIPIADAQVSVADNIITINPTNDLKQNAPYYVQIDNGAIQDMNGNNFVGIADNTTWDFRTGGAAFFPLDDATDVALDVNLTMTFTKDVKAGSGNITIVDETGGGANNIVIPIIDPQITFSGTQVIINPTDYLKNNNAYHILIDATAIDFLAGGDYEGISETTTWNFSTINDAVAPTLTTKIPDVGATDVALGQDIILTFDEKVKGRTGGSITLSGTGVTGSPLNLPVNNSQITFAGNTVVINLTSPFINNNQTVTVDIPNSAIEDLAGNAFAGDNWSFTTVSDNTEPSLVSTSPANSATGVLLDANIVITFDEEIQEGTGDITITDDSDGSDDRTIAVDNAQVTYEGNSLIINLTSDLENNTNYSVSLPIGGVQDLAGNATTASVDFSFTTVNDGAAPTVVTFSPADNSTEVNLDVNLQVTFSENIKAGTGDITLREVGGATIDYDVTSASELSISGNTLIINPAADLMEGKTYEIGIPNTAITDIAGNNFAGFNNTSGTWNFDTRDLSAPIIGGAFSPADDATGVTVGSNLVVTFSENVVKGGGNIKIKGGTSDIIIPVSDAQVSISTNTMTINPTSDLERDTDYHILLDAGTVRDAAGNDFAGISDATTWNFQTEADVTPPTIVSYSPADGSTGVAVATNFVIKFDEPVNVGTGNITITDGITPITVDVTNGSEVSIDADELTVTINPATDLAQSTAYYINIPAGAFVDKASTPNAFAGILDNTTWNFITIDAVAPTLVGLSPADDATNIPVGVNLEMTFSENVQAGSGNITLKGGSSDIVINVTSGEVTFTDNIVIINPAADLEQSINYYVQIDNGAIQDLSGNSYAGIADNITWNFGTVSDGIAPTITNRTPADDATGVILNTNFIITFSENVVAGTGNFIIEGGASPISISATDASQVTFSGNMVTINPSLDLEENTAYHIKIQPTAVKDNADNFFVGISNTTDWNFTSTADNIAPTITAYSPEVGATEVSLTTNLQITFSENVDKGASGNITLQAAGEPDIVKAVTSGDVSITDNVVTITNLTLVATKQYSVLIDAGAFRDEAASPNDFGGINTATTWQFTTLDQTAPVVSTLSPADEATDVAFDANLVITFDETVQVGTGNITITGGSSPITIAVTDNTQVSVSGSTVTINPINLLENNTAYEVTVPAGAFKDIATAQNNFGGITTGEWNFTTLNDQANPTVTNYSPASGATNVAIGTNFTITFDETIQAGTGNIVINGGASPISIPITSGQVTFAGNTVTINPASDLTTSTPYFITIDATAIQDLVGNNFAGIADANTWAFTTSSSVSASDCSNPPQQPIITRNGDQLTSSTTVEAYWWLLDGELLNLVSQTIDIQGPGTYTVVAWEGNCRSEVSDGFVIAIPITSLEDLKDEQVKVYPNPSEGIFFIEIPEMAVKTLQAKVYDINGLEVYSQSFENTTNKIALNLINMSSGKYVLRLQIGGKIVVKQLIKN